MGLCGVQPTRLTISAHCACRVPAADSRARAGARRPYSPEAKVGPAGSRRRVDRCTARLDADETCRGSRIVWCAGSSGPGTGDRRRRWRRVVERSDHAEQSGEGSLAPATGPQLPAGLGAPRQRRMVYPANATSRTTPPATRLTATPAAEAFRSSPEKSAKIAQPPRARAEGVAFVFIITLPWDLRSNAGPQRFALRAAAVARTGTSEGRVPENSGEKVATDARVPVLHARFGETRELCTGSHRRHPDVRAGSTNGPRLRERASCGARALSGSSPRVLLPARSAAWR